MMRRATALVWLIALAPALGAEAALDYDRDVRPLLSDRCFKCHGPDAAARRGKFRLDVRAEALVPRDGIVRLAPGRPEESELLLRILSPHADEVMPPPDEGGRPLSPAEQALIRRWIAEGAPYAPHWSLVPPRSPSPPATRDVAWPVHDLDRFVLARLEREGLTAAPAADPATLLRRVSLDLTGLPPTLAELNRFLADPSPAAFAREVDRLLASPAFGERMAVDWLDAARYADTNGFFRDNARQAWPWRDWVVDAFNRNLPFDQFTIEQLAGDLLPEPTQAQRIATGFNRNHGVSGETGIIDEEYRVEYVADRVETTATVWLGLTLGCARCHDHKYDPISQREYFGLFAYFNGSVERGLVNPDDPPPVLDVTTPAQKLRLAELRTTRSSAERSFQELLAPTDHAREAWASRAAAELGAPADPPLARYDFEPAGTATPPGGAVASVKGYLNYEGGVVGEAATFDGTQHVEFAADTPLSADQPWTLSLWVRPSNSLVCLLAKIEPAGDRTGVEVLWAKGQIQVNLVDRWVASALEVQTRDPVRRGDWTHLVLTYDASRRAAGLRVYADGREAPLQIVRDNLAGPAINQRPLRLGRRDSGLGYYGQMDQFRLLGRVLSPAEVRTWYWGERLARPLAAAPEGRDARARAWLVDCFVEREGAAALRAAHAAATQARGSEEEFRAQLPKTLVMQEAAQQRATRVLLRGQYDAPGDGVQPGVPAVLPALPADAPANRLGLARWLVRPDHPLTARVAVNRLWALCFGEGLVNTPNDFGAQGALPTHPELLDWLATRYVASGWDTKALLRLLVTSATYRQSSVTPAALRQRDPANRLLGRAPSFRLPAEMIRDQALAAAGLLVDRRGGPPVKPYQPPGLWEAVSYNGELTYEIDPGEGRWRRSLYTFWKRTAPPPAMQILDGPTRETCVVARPRTNTPLQALLLLNDEGYVEAARALAARVLVPSGLPDAARCTELFRLVLARPPAPEELAVLQGLLTRQQQRYRDDPAAARRLTAVGATPAGRKLDPAELAAWTTVAQTVLNLDEALTRR
ncbi:MAG: hypothetical protein RLZZ447_2204 [Verrucomicrobiota bacterium]